MKRWTRTTLEIFGPPAMATVLLAAMFGASRRDVGILREIPTLTAIAYLYAIVPSILYALVMEWGFCRFLSPASWTTVAFSAVLGALAGLGIILVINPHHASSNGYVTMAMIGLAVGTVLGGFIVIRSRKAHVQSA